MYLCFGCGSVGGVCGECVGGLDQGLECCDGVMTQCRNSLWVVFNPVAPYRYLLPNVYSLVAYIKNPDLFVCGCGTWFCLDIARFYEEQCQPSSGSA